MAEQPGQKKSLIDIYLPAPNPIFEKGKLKVDENVKLRYGLTQSKPFHNNNSEEVFEETDTGQIRPMWQYFEDCKSKIVYQRYNNHPWTMIPLNNIRFVASTFYDVRKLLSLKQQLNTTQDLIAALQKNTPSNKKVPPLVQEQETKNYKGLRFNSNFESGNLYSVIRVGEREYDLILQNDTNSKGNTQWFYFSVDNTVKGQVVKFNIINFVNHSFDFQLKNDSLFNYGQQPVCLSLKKNEKNKTNIWTKCGQNLHYYKNKFRKENSSTRTYYSLSFTHKFDFTGDTVYFAHCYPYTYRDLMKKLESLEADPKTRRLFQTRELCKTIGKLSVPVLTINSGSEKPIILIMSRQHPGETPGSFMMEGTLDFILGPSQEAEYLRMTNNFIIIPMINPDGVVHGNYRCNLFGVDLNRNWHNPHKENHDSIYYVRELVKNFSKQNQINLIIDLHGHSKKYNSFFYGNPSQNPIRTRMLPLVASRINPTISIIDSSFSVSDNKRNTARVALQQEIQGLCYTFETSFHGFQKSGLSGTQAYTPDTYKALGRDILLAYFKCQEQYAINIDKGFEPLLSHEKDEDIDNFMKEVNNNIDVVIHVGENESSGSESNPEADDLQEVEAQSMQVTIRKQSQEEAAPPQPQRVYSLKGKRRSKFDKQTQTDLNQFQTLMLDPAILKVVEQQLQDIRKSQPQIGQKRPNSEQNKTRKGSDEDLNSDIPHNSIHGSAQPIQISGQQFRKSQKRTDKNELYQSPLSSFVYNFSKTSQMQTMPYNFLQVDKECQTAISLHQILGRVQIFQIRLQQNQIFKSSFPLQGEKSKKDKPLIILLQNPPQYTNTLQEQQKTKQNFNFSIVQPPITQTPKQQHIIYQKRSQEQDQLQTFMNAEHTSYRRTDRLRTGSLNQSPNRYSFQAEGTRRRNESEELPVSPPSFILINEKKLLNSNKQITQFKANLNHNLRVGRHITKYGQK